MVESKIEIHKKSHHRNSRMQVATLNSAKQQHVSRCRHQMRACLNDIPDRKNQEIQGMNSKNIDEHECKCRLPITQIAMRISHCEGVCPALWSKVLLLHSIKMKTRNHRKLIVSLMNLLIGRFIHLVKVGCTCQEP